ncbi:ankyrin repeat domain-containing protein [Larkinella soli]|uniref:ankyrin repeat domain-containing protein n=1 Tax=Larkinella soli TaxID=1770527 RepID=UPI000FFB0C5C|nr:ankyrin repeat domain-containing protein [Larkinella soli]
MKRWQRQTELYPATTFQKAKIDLDNKLFHEITSLQPNLQTVQRLVEGGADVNAVSSTGNSVLQEAIAYLQPQQDLSLIELLLKLGANANYAQNGYFNCLFNAGLTQRPELVILLLEAGADPNCISKEDHESLLDWAKFDQFLEETDHPKDDSGKEMAEIVHILKQYGAK